MDWISANLLDLVQTLSIVVGFIAAIYNFRELRREQRIENSIKITESHREIWRITIENDELLRLLDSQADPLQEPPTFAERLFVRFVALHYNTVIEAVTAQRLSIRPGLREEVGSFFALPVPSAIWDDVRHSQSRAVVDFVDGGIELVRKSSGLKVSGS